MRDTAQWKHIVLSSRREQGAGHLQRVRGEDVVIGQAVDEQKGAGELGCAGQQRGSLVGNCVVVRIS